MAETTNIDKPTTVAVIDIGSNSIRMAIAEVDPTGRLNTLERTQRAVHMGQDTFVAGRLGGQTMSVAIGILQDYRTILDTYQVAQIRAVATSAVREAANCDAFLDRVYMSTGLDVEVIDPSEESRLTVSAVRESLDHASILEKPDALIADVGGGSGLLTVLRRGEIAASESYRLGSIRLQEVLSLTDEPPQRAAELIRNEIAGILTGIASSLSLGRIKTFLAVGGDARFAARRIGRKTKWRGLLALDLNAFDELVEDIQRLSPPDLARQFDLTFADAETILPALLVYQALVHATSARRIVVSEACMRDGILLDLARGVTGSEDRHLAESIITSALSLGEKYRVDPAHAGHVADLAVRLFDELRDQHGLKMRHRLLLRVAALLHEVGGFVSSRAHHKHSHYLLANSEIFGLGRDEMAVVALIARYHRRSPPRQSHSEYMAMPRERRVVVSKLAAILRVADALDRGHQQQIREFHVERKPDELTLHCRGVADLTLERRSMPRKADLFEDIFGLRVRLEEAPLPAPSWQEDVNAS